jgi:hypothetical protein
MHWWTECCRIDWALPPALATPLFAPQISNHCVGECVERCCRMRCVESHTRIALLMPHSYAALQWISKEKGWNRYDVAIGKNIERGRRGQIIPNISQSPPASPPPAQHLYSMLDLPWCLGRCVMMSVWWLLSALILPQPHSCRSLPPYVASCVHRSRERRMSHVDVGPALDRMRVEGDKESNSAAKCISSI